MASAERGEALDESHRSSVVGNNKGIVFLVGYEREKVPNAPKRLRNYNSNRKTAEEIANTQRIAEERKKKHDENKVRQARKVREEAVHYDKMMQARFGASGEPKRRVPGEKKWYSNAFKGD